MESENLSTAIANTIRTRLREDIKIAIENLNNQLATIADTNIPLAVYYPVNRAVIDMPL